MVALLWLLLFQSPGSAGIELNPADPQAKNYDAILQCLRTTPWSWSPAGPRGGCRVTYTPGTYYLSEPINIPNGVTDIYLKGVNLKPCADMGYLISMSTMGPAPGPVLHDFVVDTSQACGTYTPPIRQVTRWD